MEKVANVYRFPFSFFVVTTNHVIKETLERLCSINSKSETKTVWIKNPSTGRSTKSTETKVTVFAGRSHCGTRYGLLISEYDKFVELLTAKGITMDRVNVIDPEDFVPDSIDIALKPGIKPRESQIPAVNFLNDPANQRLAVLQAATGFGKTILGIMAMCNRKVRTAFSMEPAHIKTWVSSIKEFVDIDDDDIYYIQGVNSIKKAIDLRNKGEFNFKLVLVSASTVRSFIKDFEANGINQELGGKSPLTLWQFLGIGLLIRDEAHESTHALVRQSIYSTVGSQLCLSATLVSDDPFITNQYLKVFPLKNRWRSPFNKHLTMHSLMYGASKRIKCNGFAGYSAVKYEQSIMKDKQLLERYLSLMGYVLRLFKSEYKEGKKAMFMVSTLKMVDLVKEYFVEEFPEFHTEKYVGGSPKDNLYTPTVVIGTVKSLGVGIDLPNLAMCCLTSAISSTQLSEQIAGRPRPIKRYPEDDPRFVYFVNTTIPAHIKYHIKRRTNMANKIKRYSEIRTNFSI